MGKRIIGTASSCQVVDDFATQTRTMSAPGGTLPLGDAIPNRSSFGGFQIQRYDCAGG